MWSYGLNLRSNRLTDEKAFVSSEGICSNCLFVGVFDYYLKFCNDIFDFLTSNSRFLNFCWWGPP